MQLRTLDYTVLIVDELEASLEFYCGLLGMALAHRTTHYVQLMAGSTRLSLFTRKAMSHTLGRALAKPDENAPGFEIAFLVDDVDAAFAELSAKGARVEAEPVDRFCGGSAPATCATQTVTSSS